MSLNKDRDWTRFAIIGVGVGAFALLAYYIFQRAFAQPPPPQQQPPQQQPPQQQPPQQQPPPPTTGTITAYTRDEYVTAIKNILNTSTNLILSHIMLVEDPSAAGGRGKEILDALIATYKRIAVTGKKGPDILRFSLSAIGPQQSTDLTPLINYFTANGVPVESIRAIQSRAKVLLANPVIDSIGNVTSGTAVIGTNNWTNQSLTANEEFNIVSTQPHIADALFKFHNALWTNQSVAINTLSTIDTQFITTDYLNRLLTAINNASTRLYCTINFTDFDPTNPAKTPNTTSLINAIISIKQQKPSIDMRVLLDRTFPAAARDYLKSKLPTGTVKVLPATYFGTSSGILHAKTFLVDSRCFVSSQNWTNGDLVSSRGATISTTDSSVITKYLSWFGRLWSNAQ